MDLDGPARETPRGGGAYRIERLERKGRGRRGDFF